MLVSHNFLQIQALGFDVWRGQFENLLRVARKALDALNAKKIAQVSLRCKGYFDVKMRHPEIVEAMFGSYFLPRQDLESVSASLERRSCEA